MEVKPLKMKIQSQSHGQGQDQDQSQTTAARMCGGKCLHQNAPGLALAFLHQSHHLSPRHYMMVNSKFKIM